MLQALGSKGVRAKARKQRRDSKKKKYERYLDSPRWQEIRARVLERDSQRCLACGKTAHHVHHIRYPEKLGNEKLEWLYSVCRRCHSEIHRLAKKMPLRDATHLILNGGGASIVRLEDDWRLSPKEARRRQLGGLTSSQKKRARRGPRPFGAATKKKTKIEKMNDELHEIQKRNREKRARRAAQS